MFTNLLVPLDGSKLAESVLPWTRWITDLFHSNVLLLHIIEREAPRRIHGDQHLTEPEAAERYLESISARFAEETSPGTHVHTVAEGNVAASIAQHADEHSADLTIICTHGGTGARNVLVGSIAQQVLRQVRTPVLLIRPEMHATENPGLDRILVLLDGTPEAERILPLASGLASATGASLYLLIVVPTVGTVRGDRAAAARVSPFATAAVLDMEQENAVEYAEERTADMRSKGIEATAGVVRGDVAKLVNETAKQPEMSLVAMASHGRSGLGALWSSSVGNRVQLGVSKPLLLLNPALSSDGS